MLDKESIGTRTRSPFTVHGRCRGWMPRDRSNAAFQNSRHVRPRLNHWPLLAALESGCLVSHFSSLATPPRAGLTKLR